MWAPSRIIVKSVEPVKVWLPALLLRKKFSMISTGSEQPCSGQWSLLAEGPFPGKHRVVSLEVAQWRQLPGLLPVEDVYVTTERGISPFSNLTCPCSSAKSLWGENVNTEGIVSRHDSSSFCPNLNSFSPYLMHLFHALKNEKFSFLTLHVH